MKAMILAAGFGIRLAPLTESLPKALVPVAGKPMIAYAIEAVMRAGANEIIVNAHHHAEMLEEHFRTVNYGIPVTVIREDEILGTGGGIINAHAALDGDEPFLVHNADIHSDFDLKRLYERLLERKPLAVLAVHQRETSRALLFEPSMNFIGKEVWKDDGWVYPDRSLRFGFCGIHLISAEIFSLGFPKGFSDVFEIYRTALERRMHIEGVQFNGRWYDFGSVEKIESFTAKDS